MARNLEDYACILFDCDGVILNSNHIKTQAFHAVSLRFGEKIANQLVAYHLHHGGISRYKKFDYLIRNILLRQPREGELESLLEQFSTKVKQELLCCEQVPGLKEMKDASPCARWLVVSGGDQSELRHVFAERGISSLFDGIFGSPDTKSDIIAREQELGNIGYPVLFLGDSRLDYEVANKFSFDFIFVHGFTEFLEWRTYFRDLNVSMAKDLRDIVGK